MKGNVCYQKTDFGSETPDLLNKYVLKITQIAGINLKNDITAKQLREALSVPTLVSQLENDSKYVDETALSSEVSRREQTDKTVADLAEQLSSEVTNRENGDAELKKTADADRDTQDKQNKTFTENIAALQKVAHSHENKEVLDEITDERVALWDTVKDFESELDLVDYKNYINDILFGYQREFALLYSIIGVTVYDGGIFGMEVDGEDIDGGDFDDEPESVIDCGDFEPITVSVGTATDTLDGGTY